MTNVNDLVRDHVTLTVECLDRIYLNAYIPTLQMPGQRVNFVIGHQGNKIPSPALQGRLTDDFKAQRLISVTGVNMTLPEGADSSPPLLCARVRVGSCGSLDKFKCRVWPVAMSALRRPHSRAMTP